MKLGDFVLMATAWAFGAAALLIIYYGLLAYEQTLFTIWWWAMAIAMGGFLVIAVPLFVGGLILIAMDRTLFWVTESLRPKDYEVEETVGMDEVEE